MKDTRLPRGIVLHLGAHRTGTTRIQKILDENSTQMRAHGIECLTPPRPGKRDAPTIRRVLADIRKSALRRYWWQRYAARQRARSACARWCRPSNSCRVVLLSEENLLGNIFDVAAPRSIYPEAEHLLMALKKCLPYPVTRVCIGIRSYDTFLVSAYAMLAVYGTPLPPFEEIAPRRAPLLEGWPLLVQRARDAFPAAELRVWKYEEADLDRQLGLLGAEAAGKLTYSTGDRVNAAPTLEAIQAAAAARAKGVAHDPDAVVERFRSGTRFDPLDDETKAILVEQYAHDCDAMRDFLVMSD